MSVPSKIFVSLANPVCGVHGFDKLGKRCVAATSLLALQANRYRWSLKLAPLPSGWNLLYEREFDQKPFHISFAARRLRVFGRVTGQQDLFYNFAFGP